MMNLCLTMSLHGLYCGCGPILAACANRDPFPFSLTVGIPEGVDLLHLRDPGA